MSTLQSFGTRRNRSGLTRYRHDQLPIGVKADVLEDANFSRENLLEPTFRGFTVRLCPRSRQRIARLLELPHLHPDVRQIYCGLLAWATD